MSDLIGRLGWMLLHSLWEGAIVWLLLQVSLIALQKKSAQARYIAGCLALALMAFLPWMTFGSMDLSSRLRSTSPSSVSPLVQSEDVSSSFAPALSAGGGSTIRATGSLDSFLPPPPRKSFMDAFLPWLVGGWLFGVTAFACRLWISWRSVRRLARTHLDEMSAAWQQRLEELCCTAGVRSIVRAGETAVVVVPLVVGWLKPVILLPLGVLTQLPAEQVEAVLLHELAHIRRHDFLVNMLQSVVETLFFYHPAVRSISRHIREERERVCDDLSVEWCRNPMVYAEALTTFEEYRRRSLALAVTGQGDLLSRIRRIIFGIEPPQRMVNLFAVAGFLAMGVYFASMFLMPLLAAELMTDTERIAAIQALQPRALEPVPIGSPDPQVELSGTLRTRDGHPLPKSLLTDYKNLDFVSSETHIKSIAGGMTGNAILEFNGNAFSSNPMGGDVGLGIWTEGYAPLLMDHLEIKNGKIGPLSLVLERGFPARLRLLTPEGKPLANVGLRASTRPMTRYPEVGVHGVQTDANGEAVVGNVDASTVLSVNASKAGWQPSEKILGDWAPDQVISWTMEAAIITRGTIVSQTDSKPVSGAILSLASRSDPAGPITYNPLEAPVVGRGNENGHFTLDDLNPNTSYTIYVKAPGHPYAVFPIQPGDQNVRLSLPRGFHVNGRILNPHGLMEKAFARYRMPPEIFCDLSVEVLPSQSWGYMLGRPLPKLGPVISFSFDDLPRGRADFSISNLLGSHGYSQRYLYNVDHDVDDYVIDLSKAPSPPADVTPPARPQRVVEITLVAEKDHPIPTGHLDMQYWLYGDGPGVSSPVPMKNYPIVNGIVKDSFSTPNKLTPNSDDLPGYWFKEEAFDVPVGSEPFRKTIEVTLAGAIHGRVTSEAVLRDKLFTCTPIVIKPPLALEGVDLNPRYAQPQGSDRYVTHPLPFGGIYAIVLQQGPSTYVVSPSISIDTEHPIVNLDLHLAGHDNLRGKFVDENNRPIALKEVNLTYKPNEETSLAPSIAARTALDGTFAIPNMNFDVPGTYEVQLEGDDWEKTKVRINGRTSQPVIISVHRKGQK
jgi:beta-lactamase regulating signal transducer with metallopeptidase domain